MVKGKTNKLLYTFLVLDDDTGFLQFVKGTLKKEGYNVLTAQTAEEAFLILDSSFVDVIFCDYQLISTPNTKPGINGLEFLKIVKPKYKDIPFIMVTGHGTVEAAVDAMKSGAFDFITKPVENNHLILVAQKTIDHIKLTRELNSLRSEVASKYEFSEIIGSSQKMQQLFQVMRQVAKSDATVLIHGESGTGKELVARALHYNSSRARQPFLAINCNAIPETLLEAELFGYVKGAFTGAIRSKKGYFLESQGGTIFLDEIGDVSHSLQTKLLRVLQEREIRPVGGDESDIRKIDIRVITASHQDLKQAITEHKFREDLYSRLGVITVEIPPLRDRKTDIPLISANFIRKYFERTKIDVKTLTPQALEALLSFDWPGNVRQLENVLERAIVLGQSNKIETTDLPEEVLQNFSPINSDFLASKFSPNQTDNLKNANGTLKEIVQTQIDRIEKEIIIKVLKSTKDNKAQTAKKLGISRASLYNKIKHHNLD